MGGLVHEESDVARLGYHTRRPASGRGNSLGRPLCDTSRLYVLFSFSHAFHNWALCSHHIWIGRLLLAPRYYCFTDVLSLCCLEVHANRHHWRNWISPLSRKLDA